MVRSLAGVLLGGGMRFFHKECNAIVVWVKTRNLKVAKVDCDGLTGSIIVSESEIEEMLRQSNELWGAALPYYLKVADTFTEGALSLSNATELVESGVEKASFLIAAYQDGGLITISNAQFEFQKQARAADWWRPESRSVRFLSRLQRLFRS